MITVLDWDMLTPAAFAMSNANDVDVGVGRSMLINNIRWGKEIDPIMKDLDPRFMPDWAKLGSRSFHADQQHPLGQGDRPHHERPGSPLYARLGKAERRV